MNNKQARLDQIRADIQTKNICPDLAKTAKQLVFGSGNIDADIVFIGEAPGKKEDETGEPFVGASGKLLDQMLASIHLQRQDIYITNIVKYRPPENRDPSPVEKEAFMPYLFAQLAVINPKLIITLGRHSTNCFLPGLQIGDIHGQTYGVRIKNQESRILTQNGERVSEVRGNGEERTEVCEKYSEGAQKPLTKQFATNLSGAANKASQQDEMTLIILPLYHPAAALYNGGLRKIALKDFVKIPSIIKSIEQ